MADMGGGSILVAGGCATAEEWWGKAVTVESTKIFQN